MENNSLYTKYRPRKFKDIYGQDYVSDILKNQIKLKKFSHAYLFSGTRGTGKTTCARIFAKAINCNNSIDGEPCYECSVCKLDHNNLNIIELDAASNNSVDQIRSLVEELRYSTFIDGYKVYILDEVHMLSISAFNALLKSLEEPPSNVVFILSTTEIKKIPQTIISRCQKFEFKHIDITKINSRITSIAHSEGIEIDLESVDLISKLADGSMRDAISILERVALSKNNITIEDTRKILGITSSEIIFDIIRSIKSGSITDGIYILSKVFNNNTSIKNFIFDFRNILRDMMFVKISKDNLDILVEKNKFNINKIIEISNHLNLNDIIFVLNEINKINEKKDLDDVEYRVYLEIFIIKITSKFNVDVENISIKNEIKEIPKNDDGLLSYEVDSREWKDFLNYLKNNKYMVLYSLLTNGKVQVFTSNKISFKCSTEGILKRLNKEDTLRDIKSSLYNYYKRDIDFQLVNIFDNNNSNINEKLKGYFGDDIEIEKK